MDLCPFHSLTALESGEVNDSRWVSSVRLLRVHALNRLQEVTLHTLIEVSRDRAAGAGDETISTRGMSNCFAPFLCFAVSTGDHGLDSPGNALRRRMGDVRADRIPIGVADGSRRPETPKLLEPWWVRSLSIDLDLDPKDVSKRESGGARRFVLPNDNSQGMPRGRCRGRGGTRITDHKSWSSSKF